MEQERMKCTECGEIKGITLFPRVKNGHPDRKLYCKKCSLRIAQQKIYARNQLAKQTNNLCLTCQKSLVGYMLNRKYCDSCMKGIERAWKKDSYIRNKKTYQTYFKEHKSEIYAKNREREHDRRKDIADRYVTKLLREKHGFTPEQLRTHPEIIEVKRLILKIKRECRTSQSSEKA